MHHARQNKRAYETLKMLTKTKSRITSIIEDSNGLPLVEDKMILELWTEYCEELYNHQINLDISVLSNNEHFNTYDDLPILESDVN